MRARVRALSLAAGLAALGGGRARAQGLPSAVLVAPEAAADVPAGAAAAFQKVLRSSSESAARFSRVRDAALGLDDVLLVAGCTQQEARCIRAAARPLHAERLIATTLSVEGANLRARLRVFDLHSGEAVDDRVSTVPLAQAEDASALGHLFARLWGSETIAPPPVHETSAVAAAPPPARTVHRPFPFGWTTIGAAVLTVAFAVTGAAFALQVGSLQAQFNQTSDATRDGRLQLIDLQQRGQQAVTLSMVFYGLAAAAVVGTGVLAVLDLRRHPEQPDANVAPTAALGPGFGWVGVLGRF